jgi:hypothetical protein
VSGLNACPNDPRCPHPDVVHDIFEWGDPRPMCCVGGCYCGHASDCQIRTRPPAGFPFPTFTCNCAPVEA